MITSIDNKKTQLKNINYSTINKIIFIKKNQLEIFKFTRNLKPNLIVSFVFSI